VYTNIKNSNNHDIDWFGGYHVESILSFFKEKNVQILPR